MAFAPDFNCAFIGFGLIAGSIAKAFRKYYPACALSAYAPSGKNTTPAFTDGTLNKIMESVTDGISDADLIILCGPVTLNENNMAIIAPHLKPGAILTDVGSVKGNIVRKAAELGISSSFIGGHPMAGSEKTGYAFATEDLLTDANYILTPTSENKKEDIEALTGLLSILKCKIIITDVEKHDKATAAISHVPHLISAGLVEMVMQEDSEDGFMKEIAAGGFRDTSRIAASSPTMWKQICETNTENIIDLLENYIGHLEEIKTHLEEKNFDEIANLFGKTGPYRESFKQF